jgi:hypothetical protein
LSLSEVFQSVSDFFRRERMDFAVIGAFALYGYGYVRATKDIDFILRRGDQRQIVAFLESIGFETVHCSHSFSNHLHPIGLTRVDLMYVEGPTADTIFSSATEKLILNGQSAPVVSVEHLIALKLFAAHNNPGRTFKELSDIQEVICRTDVNLVDIKKYFTKYGLEKYYDNSINRKS